VNVPREEDRLATIHSLSQGIVKLLAPGQELKFEQDFGHWAANPAVWAVRESVGGGDLVYTVGKQDTKARERSWTGGAPQGLDTTLVAGMFLQVILEAEHLPGNTLERTSFVKQAVKNFLVQRLAGQITLSQFFRLVQIIEHEVTYYFHRLQGEWLSPEEAAPVTPLSGLGTGYAVASAPAMQTYDLRLALSRLPLPHQANRKLSPEGLFDFLVKSEGRWFRLLDFESQFRLNKKTAWTYLTLLLHHDILRHNEEKANKVRYSLSLKFMAPENVSRS
jgi:hypothetical protein